MCVIIAKEKGKKLPSKSFLAKCFNANPHGCGMMYNHENSVIIEKGFMSFECFYNRLSELNKEISLENRSIVFHFRISTSGKIDAGNCHPYPITQDYNLLRETFLMCSDVAFCHNGIIRKYSPKNSIYNDTQTFGAEVISTFKSYDNEFYKNKNVMKMIENLSESKLCFLNNNGDVFYVGRFFEEKGYMCSNLFFMNNKPKYRTRTKSDFEYYYEDRLFK